MAKLRLDLDALEVDSFEPSEIAGGEGTIHAHADGSCSMQRTCGAASRGDQSYDLEALTRYACCV